MSDVSCRSLIDWGSEDVISGLVDRDEDELGDIVNLFQLHRYSIENYLLDPVYLYVYLMHHGHALSVDLKQQVPPGGEQVLRQWPGCELQKIADAVIRGACEGAEFRGGAIGGGGYSRTVLEWG